MIERLRNRRCWGETLPPTGDRCYGERRIRLIESIERQEWVVREAEISQIQVGKGTREDGRGVDGRSVKCLDDTLTG